LGGRALLVTAARLDIRDDGRPRQLGPANSSTETTAPRLPKYWEIAGNTWLKSCSLTNWLIAEPSSDWKEVRIEAMEKRKSCLSEIVVFKNHSDTEINLTHSPERVHNKLNRTKKKKIMISTKKIQPTALVPLPPKALMKALVKKGANSNNAKIVVMTAHLQRSKHGIGTHSYNNRMNRKYNRAKNRKRPTLGDPLKLTWGLNPKP
jgi:hypothetical protein